MLPYLEKKSVATMYNLGYNLNSLKSVGDFPINFCHSRI